MRLAAYTQVIFPIIMMVASTISAAQPSAAVLAKTQGDELLAKEQYEAADRAYRDALAADYAYASAHFGLAKAHAKRLKMNDAARSYALAVITFGTSNRMRALQKQQPLPNPDNGGLWALIGMVLLVEGSGSVVWISPLAELADILFQYDAAGKPIPAETIRLLKLSGPPGSPNFYIGRDAFLKLNSETRDRVESAMNLHRLALARNAIQGSAPWYSKTVQYSLHFDDERWCDAAKSLTEVATLRPDLKRATVQPQIDQLSALCAKRR